MSTTSIEGVRGERGSDGTLARLEVEVELSGCAEKQVLTQVTCIDAASSKLTRTFNTVDEGTQVLEYADSDLDDLDCGCGDEVSIVVKCTGPEESKDTWSGTIDCDCPAVSAEVAGKADECVDGKRDVTLEADFADVYATPVRFQWRYDQRSNDYSQTFTRNTATNHTHTRAYPPGRYTAELHVVSPQNCSTKTVTFDVECESPEDCPTIEDISADYGECGDDGEKREVTLTATVDGAGADTFKWAADDGWESSPIDASENPTGTVSHDFDAPGDGHNSYDVTLTLVGEDADDCVDAKTETIDVPGCGQPCPDLVGDLEATPGECSDGERTVSFDPPHTNYRVDELVWDWDDGTRDRTGPNESPVEHAYDSAGTKTVEMTAEGPGDCSATAETEVDVEPCPGMGDSDDPGDDDGSGGGGGGGDGGSGGDWGLACGIARVFAAVALALAVLTGLLATCLPAAAPTLATVAGGLAIVGVVGGAVFAAVCDDKPCKWGLLMAGQALLGAGVTATILSNCCPWMLPAGLAIALVGLLALVGWKEACDESWCRVAAEVTYVVAGIVLPVFGVVNSIPAVQACVDDTALAIVSGAAGGNAAAAVGCSQGDD